MSCIEPGVSLTLQVKTYSGTAITCVCKGYPQAALVVSTSKSGLCLSGHCVGLVGSWRCDDGPFGGHYTISLSYSDDWTPETNRDSLLLCTVARPGAWHMTALCFVVL